MKLYGLLFAFLITAGVFAQDAILPQDTAAEALRMPQRGESPRYPQDTVIGELGRGAASEAAYNAAAAFLSAMVQKNAVSAAAVSIASTRLGDIRAEIAAVSPEKYRLGGGLIERDGGVTFLARFLGKELSLTGELYLRLIEDAESKTSTWVIEDIILDEKRPISEERGYSYDFSPYERFY